ncbi:MAG: hypothetical protein P8X64_02665 [Anaerolineales bacterium]|jgi:hypothetical protein
MAWVTWKSIKAQRCERIGEQVALEARVVYPAEFLPDQPPRILAHRCSKGLECNQMDSATCVWAGTLPGYDPFAG